MNGEPSYIPLLLESAYTPMPVYNELSYCQMADELSYPLCAEMRQLTPLLAEVRQFTPCVR
jgi:hypothetical protein